MRLRSLTSSERLERDLMASVACALLRELRDGPWYFFGHTRTGCSASPSSPASFSSTNRHRLAITLPFDDRLPPVEELLGGGEVAGDLQGARLLPAGAELRVMLSQVLELDIRAVLPGLPIE